MTVALGTSMPTSTTVVATSRSVRPSANASMAARFSSAPCAPWTRPTVNAANGPSRSRSASVVAARASAAAPSSTSGQMTYAWRPARSSARTSS